MCSAPKPVKNAPDLYLILSLMRRGLIKEAGRFENKERYALTADILDVGLIRVAKLRQNCLPQKVVATVIARRRPQYLDSAEEGSLAKISSPTIPSKRRAWVVMFLY